jgi:hypothetical protein
MANGRIKNLAIVSLVAFGLHGVWEQAHVSLYRGYEDLSPFLPITLWATFGDVFYTLGVIGLVALFKGQLDWAGRAKAKDFIGLAIIGFFVALLVEYKALALDRWAYTPAMPIIPFFEVGFSPVLQMTILLPLSILTVRRFIRKN